MNATNDLRRLALGLTIGLAALALRSTGADALQTFITPNTAQGTLTAVGESSGSSSVAKAEVLINGKCNSQPLNAPLEVIISSGALSGTATETNSLNMKNAYSTMLAALLSGKTIELSGLSGCAATIQGPVTLDLTTGSVLITNTPQ
jgi:hypothetical protein